MACIGIMGQSGFPWKEQKQVFSVEVPSTSCKLSTETSIEEIQLGFAWKLF